jgi:hypothetical protein
VRGEGLPQFWRQHPKEGRGGQAGCVPPLIDLLLPHPIPTVFSPLPPPWYLFSHPPPLCALPPSPPPTEVFALPLRPPLERAPPPRPLSASLTPFPPTVILYSTLV